MVDTFNNLKHRISFKMMSGDAVLSVSAASYGRHVSESTPRRHASCFVPERVRACACGPPYLLRSGRPPIVICMKN